MRVRTVAVVGLVLLLAAGAATGAVRTGGPGADRLTGTQRADLLLGRGGNDRLAGRAGNDLLVGGPGRDRLLAGPGSDNVAVEADGARDSVSCGPGRDVVTAETADRVARDCELVSRQISRDRSRDPRAQHQTQVEPDSFSFGNTVVTAFQSARYENGGAATIGFATSRDGGRTWRSGFLPGVTTETGAAAGLRASDPVVAYDVVRRVWLIATLGFSTDRSESRLLISRSTDGLRWSAPVVALDGAPGRLSFDKEWLACDNWAASPFRGSCYLSFTEVNRERLATSVSRDGGLTWSPSVPTTPRNPEAVGAFPVIQPNGTLVVVYLSGREVLAARSTDNGASFAQARVAGASTTAVEDFRDIPLPSADVDASGRLYVTWADCAARPSCSANDVVLATSADAVAWTLRRLPLVRTASARQFVYPAVAVEPGTGGARARIGITYYAMPTAACDIASCRIDAGFVSSVDGGATWRAPRRLTTRPMSLGWMPKANYGRMLADYLSVSYVRGAVVAVFALASPPAADGSLRQAIFATRLAR